MECLLVGHGMHVAFVTVNEDVLSCIVVDCGIKVALPIKERDRQRESSSLDGMVEALTEKARGDPFVLVKVEIEITSFRILWADRIVWLWKESEDDCQEEQLRILIPLFNSLSAAKA